MYISGDNREITIDGLSQETAVWLLYPHQMCKTYQENNRGFVEVLSCFKCTSLAHFFYKGLESKYLRLCDHMVCFNYSVV